MFYVIVLICALAVPPGECQRETALNQIPLGRVNSELQCALQGQPRLASTALAPRAGVEYAKTICRRGR